MYKIFMTVRNRLAITRKSIAALYKHSKLPFQLYIYNNLTNYKLKEHFEFFHGLYEKKMVTQITFNTNDSVFNAFSKASACNQFGKTHEEDPNKNKIDFLTFIDNDIIVKPDWDITIKKAWEDVNLYNLNQVKCISQLPGGIRFEKPTYKTFSGFDGSIGQLGGSGFWNVRNNFFRDVGYLDLKELVGINKKHDQKYWRKMQVSANERNYILGLKTKLCIHVGGLAGSICKTLTTGGPMDRKLKQIKFEDQENFIDSMDFNEFYTYILNNPDYERDW